MNYGLNACIKFTQEWLITEHERRRQNINTLNIFGSVNAADRYFAVLCIGCVVDVIRTCSWSVRDDGARVCAVAWAGAENDRNTR